MGPSQLRLALQHRARRLRHHHGSAGVLSLRQHHTGQRRRRTRILVLLLGRHDVRCRHRRRHLLLRPLRTTDHVPRPATADRRGRNRRSTAPSNRPSQLPLGPLPVGALRTGRWRHGLLLLPPRTTHAYVVAVYPGVQALRPFRHHHRHPGDRGHPVRHRGHAGYFYPADRRRHRHHAQRRLRPHGRAADRHGRAHHRLCYLRRLWCGQRHPHPVEYQHLIDVGGHPVHLRHRANPAAGQPAAVRHPGLRRPLLRHGVALLVLG